MDNKLREIEEALCKASPGPWQHIGLRIYPIEGRPYATNEICVANRLPNAKLIANAPEWLRWQADTIKQLTKQNKNIKESWDEQKEQIRSLRAAIETSNAQSSGHHYTWIPYEENHLETLSCPVLIPAEWIRQLIEEAEGKQADTVKKLTKERDFYHEDRDRCERMERKAYELLRQKEEENKILKGRLEAVLGPD